MSLFDVLSWSTLDKRTLFVKIRSCTGDWSTEKPEIQELRKRLLELQSYRCAYCQYRLISDMVGYRELDHILPKDGNANHSDAKKISELEKDRYSTHGYPQWRFEPKNIVLICKPCNSSKGTYDSLTNRTGGKLLKRYPPITRFSCYHPHYHSYAAHIDIDENFIYSHLTDEGRVLLKICGLMTIQNLEKKFAPAACIVTLPGRNLHAVVNSLIDNLEEKNFGLGHAINALRTNRKLNQAEAAALIEQGKNCVTEGDRITFKQACESLESRMILLKRARQQKVLKKALK